MTVNYINRNNDEEIINLIREILSRGFFNVETFNESILVKLMEERRTPILVDEESRNIDLDFEAWKKGE